ncbi:iron-containing redox enzyme family protein [Candidatus Pacearchaeota archaeon]|nr:iron-containing redox enzyme family protein [Candidatus Pacearchaeota archaeon]
MTYKEHREAEESSRDSVKMMSKEQFQERFIGNMNNHRLWKHPFFSIIKDNPTKEVLSRWAIQAGRIDQAFVTILQRMLANPCIGENHALAENLDDEMGKGNPQKEHFALFMSALHALDISEDEYAAASLTDSTRLICDMLIFAASSCNPLMSLGMMASEELICPREFPPFYMALQRFAPKDSLEYFPVHIEADIEHSRELMDLCYNACQSGPDIEELFRWQFVDLELNVAFYDALLEMIQQKDFKQSV